MCTFILGPKMAKIGIFCSKSTVKVRNLYLKEFWSTLLIDCIFLVAFLFISVSPGASLDPVPILGPKKWIKSLYFGQNRRLKVHNNLHFKWFCSTLLVYSISLVAFLLISSHPGTLSDLWTLISVTKMAKISVLVKNDSLMSVDWTLIIYILIEPFCGLYTPWESVYPSIFH